ncbi:MAG: sigma-70 family RNA polymerase sigma factor [Spirochaetales bacterium]|nr:sigma-70 family RNA polymerase sigma factor [Spirochaetales bacterium]
MTMLNSNTSYEENDIISSYLKEINRIPLISYDEEYDLALKAKSGDMKAREKLINSNLRFVVSVAKQFQGQGLPFEDLINEGNIGLMVALDKYEPEKGYHFISYAVWWIRQSIMKAINEKSRAVRLPLNRANELMQIQKAQKKLMLANDGDVSLEELGRETGLDTELIKDLLAINREMISLDAPILNKGEESNTKVLDSIEYEGMSPEESTLQGELKKDIETALSTLSEKERAVIIRRFGLYDTTPLSLKEIGDIFGLTKERIRQIEKKALEKMAQGRSSELLSTYMAG